MSYHLPFSMQWVCRIYLFYILDNLVFWGQVGVTVTKEKPDGTEVDSVSERSTAITHSDMLWIIKPTVESFVEPNTCGWDRLICIAYYEAFRRRRTVRKPDRLWENTYETRVWQILWLQHRIGITDSGDLTFDVVMQCFLHLQSLTFQNIDVSSLQNIISIKNLFLEMNTVELQWLAVSIF